MSEHWRLLIDPPYGGAMNMARDEALLIGCATGASPPTLRLYRWQPVTLSLGRFQRSGAVSRAACVEQGVHVVRRPSGGRALLHDDELTYAVAVRDTHPLFLGSDVSEAYQRISGALLEGILRLGVAAELAPCTRRSTTDDRRPTTNDRRSKTQDARHNTQDARRKTQHARRNTQHVTRRSAACYDASVAFEVTVAGRKLIGSAQARRQGAILQHGAIPFTPHADRLVALLTDPAPDLNQRMASLSEGIGVVSFDAVAQALIAGFAEAWGVTLDAGGWTDEELQLADELYWTKYTSDEWT
ncbi:MAG: lipoate--protein ligase family protein, partial [Blastochloris sp.]|nr:lipoate--protein ligase family protein [Blastochloris sp.]